MVGFQPLNHKKHKCKMLPNTNHDIDPDLQPWKRMPASPSAQHLPVTWRPLGTARGLEVSIWVYMFQAVDPPPRATGGGWVGGWLVRLGLGLVWAGFAVSLSGLARQSSSFLFTTSWSSQKYKVEELRKRVN